MLIATLHALHHTRHLHMLSHAVTCYNIHAATRAQHPPRCSAHTLQCSHHHVVHVHYMLQRTVGVFVPGGCGGCWLWGHLSVYPSAKQGHPWVPKCQGEMIHGGCMSQALLGLLLSARWS